MFTSEDLRARLKGKPFVPVRIVTSSGQSYDITHPDLVVIGKRDLFIGIPSNDNPDIYDASSRIAILHISDMQDIPRVSSPGTNGPPA
jgi:hypothetical protein